MVDSKFELLILLIFTPLEQILLSKLDPPKQFEEANQIRATIYFLETHTSKMLTLIHPRPQPL